MLAAVVSLAAAPKAVAAKTDTSDGVVDDAVETLPPLSLDSIEETSRVIVEAGRAPADVTVATPIRALLRWTAAAARGTTLSGVS